MLFKQSSWQMGVVIRKPMPINVSNDLKRTIKDRKEVAAIDDA